MYPTHYKNAYSEANGIGKLYRRQERYEYILSHIPDKDNIGNTAMRIMTIDGDGIPLNLDTNISRQLLQRLRSILETEIGYCKQQITWRSSE